MLKRTLKWFPALAAVVLGLVPIPSQAREAPPFRKRLLTVPVLGGAAAQLDPITAREVRHSLTRLVKALAEERRLARIPGRMAGVFSRHPVIGAKMWAIISSGQLKLRYSPAPITLHRGEWTFTRLWAQPATQTIYVTPASTFKQMKVVDEEGQMRVLVSPHYSLEESLLHELAHLGGADEKEAVRIGDLASQDSWLSQKTYDATWLGRAPATLQ